MSITYTLSTPQDDSTLNQEVEAQLRRLRISGKLCGLRHLTYAVAKTVRDPEATRYITKELYPEIAAQFQTTASRVERTIRTAIIYSWKHGASETLDEMAGYHLTERPTNSEFIDLVAAYIRLHG